MYKSEPVKENEAPKILTDFLIQTDLQSPARSAELVTIDKKKKKKKKK